MSSAPTAANFIYWQFVYPVGLLPEGLPPEASVAFPNGFTDSECSFSDAAPIFGDHHHAFDRDWAIVNVQLYKSVNTGEAVKRAYVAICTLDGSRPSTQEPSFCCVPVAIDGEILRCVDGTPKIGGTPYESEIEPLAKTLTDNRLVKLQQFRSDWVGLDFEAIVLCWCDA